MPHGQRHRDSPLVLVLAISLHGCLSPTIPVTKVYCPLAPILLSTDIPGAPSRRSRIYRLKFAGRPPSDHLDGL